MDLVKMRDLLRDPNKVFDELEQSGTPKLLTRNGTPIAMLTRVEPANAAQAAMAVIPEFASSRSLAEMARREKRTISSEELLKDLENDSVGIEVRRMEDNSLPEDEINYGVLEEMTFFFGTESADEIAEDVALRVAAASVPVLEAVAGHETKVGVISETQSEVVRRVHELNGQLFIQCLGPVYRAKLHPTFLEWKNRKLHSPDQAARARKRLIGDVLNEVESCVIKINRTAVASEFGGSSLDLPKYSALVAGLQLRSVFASSDQMDVNELSDAITPLNS
jgi:hypothetical protein